jgi:hypothetical protein
LGLSFGPLGSSEAAMLSIPTKDRIVKNLRYIKDMLTLLSKY